MSDVQKETVNSVYTESHFCAALIRSQTVLSCRWRKTCLIGPCSSCPAFLSGGERGGAVGGTARGIPASWGWSGRGTWPVSQHNRGKERLGEETTSIVNKMCSRLRPLLALFETSFNYHVYVSVSNSKWLPQRKISRSHVAHLLI